MFVALFDFFQRRRLFLWSLFGSSLLLFAGAAVNLKYEEDVSGMLPDAGSLRVMNDALAKTAAGEQIIFILRSKSEVADPDALIEAANSLDAILLKACGAGIDTIRLGPGEGSEEALLSLVQEKLPLLLRSEDYQQFDTLLSAPAIARSVQEARRVLGSPASVVYKGLVTADPVGVSRPAWARLSKLGEGSDYEAYNGYLFADSMRALCFFVQPAAKGSETGANIPIFEKMEAAVNEWRAANQRLQVVYFGGPLVAAGNAIQARTDTILTLCVTSVLLLLLTVYFFRRKRTALLLFVPVVWGAGAGLALVYAVQGKISLIALGAGSLVLGIAVDFSIHFLAHLRHEPSVRATIKALSQPLTLGSATTIAAFLALRGVHTPILRDLGLFAAGSLSGAALCTLIFLPHLPLGVAGMKVRETMFDKLARWQPERVRWLVPAIVLLTPVMFFFARQVRFDDDLMNLNYLSPELRAAQAEVSKASSGTLSSAFLIAKGRTRDEAVQKLESASGTLQELERRGWIRALSNPVAWTPSEKESSQRQERWAAYWSAGRRDSVTRHLRDAAAKSGFAANAFDDFTARLNSGFSSYTADQQALLESLLPASFASGEGQEYAIASMRIAAGKREAVFAELQDSATTIVDRQQAASQLAGILRTDFNTIALWSSLFVAIALLIGYGRIELAVIAFLPMVISWVWILGMMALLGLKFNIVNIIVSTLIFGLGDDYAIFTMDGLLHRYSRGEEKLHTVRAGVYVSLATVLIGLGVLILAKHPALHSISLVSVVGMVCVVGVAQTLQPRLFNALIQRRAEQKKFPFTAWSLAKSCFAFLYFAVGAFLLTVVGFLFTRLTPQRARNWGSDAFHTCICGFVRSLAWIMGNVQKRYVNRENFAPQTPGVIVANHSSFLDILFILSIHPKIVLLTNNWVWNSPLFGAVVRMAEYYPVADGAEESVEALRKLVARGYSIAVFPEGTRAKDGQIGRFHKGAFFLAERLALPIKPVVLHGMGYTIPKGDWLLKDGTCALHFYPAILLDNAYWGTTYQERSKQVRQWMRAELEEIRQREETPSYFREQLLRAYTYRGPVLEWYCRIKTRLEGMYERAHALLPQNGKMYDLGCGYGFATYALQAAAPARQFVSIDYDAEKVNIAANTFLRNQNTTFISADLALFTPEPCAGILLLDVLHYMLPAQQEELLKRCAQALLPGGVMIVRDGVVELESRLMGTKRTEWWSTRMLRFNKTRNALHYIRQADMERLAKEADLELQIIDDSPRTANLTFVFTRATQIRVKSGDGLNLDDNTGSIHSHKTKQ